ncbi:MAG: hypothetical protein R2754_15640 [Microthrixaceae bacterium]
MTQPATPATADDNDPALAVARRWSVGLLVAASLVLLAGFMATDALSGDSLQRWGGPSAEPVARLRVPSEEQVRIEEPATYGLYYEQDAPSTGVPQNLTVAVRSDQGELGLTEPEAVTSSEVDGRSFVSFQEIRIPRSGTYTVEVGRPGRATISALEDDRVVIDRVDRNAEMMQVLLGLTPAALGMALAGGLGAAALWIRHRALRAWRLSHPPPSGGAGNAR